MKNDKSSIEREFRFEELFFSTTDPRGVINFANTVFVRISGFDTEEIFNAPHNIIRHQDMPRAVFYLLWDYLKQGKSISSYVKNRSKDGSYYWVYALVTPVKGGYVSVRLKPSSPIFSKAQEIYQRLRQIELDSGDRGQEGKNAMMQAYDKLAEELKILGFANYDQFMNAALIAEVNSRKAVLEGRKSEKNQIARGSHPILKSAYDLKSLLTASLDPIGAFLALDKSLRDNCAVIVNLCRSIQLLALNASIRASNLGEEGATLSTVANNLAEQSVMIFNVMGSMGSLSGRIDEVLHVVKEAAYAALASELMLEMKLNFLEEIIEVVNSGGDVDEKKIESVNWLIEATEVNLKNAAESVKSSNRYLANVKDELSELTKLITSLSFVLVTGRIESARLRSENSFNDLIAQISTEIDKAQLAIDSIFNDTGATRGSDQGFKSCLERLPSLKLSLTELVKS